MNTAKLPVIAPVTTDIRDAICVLSSGCANAYKSHDDYHKSRNYLPSVKCFWCHFLKLSFSESTTLSMLGSCPPGSYRHWNSTGHSPSTTRVYVSFAPLYRQTCCPFLAFLLLYRLHVTYFGSSLTPLRISCSHVQSLNFLRKHVKHCFMFSDLARYIVSPSTHNHSNVS
jgi:hypothetical protein